MANVNEYGVLTEVSNELSKVNFELLQKHVTLPSNVKVLHSQDIVNASVLSPCEVAINIFLELTEVIGLKITIWKSHRNCAKIFV